uniref:Major facilitator superfamily (MFS) profile domain-containing protein n=1 Tax=Mycolicibacterium brisbanense TaxID=146020 RepID=B8R4I6_9MYCO|nr:putative protein [Mycolicibacterium brisbanense]
MNDAGAGSTGSTMKATTALLCWFLVVFDGYDLVIFGAVAPALLQEPGWGMTPDSVAMIASVTLVGLFMGSLTAGNLADRFGRRAMIIATVTIFSLSMAGSAMASSALMLGGFRFLAGLGLGGLLPVMGTLVVELAPVGRKRLYHSLTFTAFPVGGIFAGGMALWLLPDFGWRAVLWIGALPLLLILPLIKTLPESSEYTRAEVSLGEPPAARGGFASLFDGRYRGATIMFGCIFAVCLFTSYGLLTWLPQIMIGAGFSLRSSLSFLLVMNTVALLLLPVAGFLAERRGPKAVCVGSFALAAISIALLAAQPPVWAVYALVGFAGFGAVGLVIQLSAYVANHYEVENRGSAMGWALGVGRLGAVAGPLVGGWLLTSGTSLVTKFFVFAAASAFGALITLAVPSPPRPAAINSVREPRVI